MQSCLDALDTPTEIYIFKIFLLLNVSPNFIKNTQLGYNCIKSIKIVNGSSLRYIWRTICCLEIKLNIVYDQRCFRNKGTILSITSNMSSFFTPGTKLKS